MGGLLSNTPWREVIMPLLSIIKNIDKLPGNILDVLHRARGIVLVIKQYSP